MPLRAVRCEDHVLTGRAGARHRDLAVCPRTVSALLRACPRTWRHTCAVSARAARTSQRHSDQRGRVGVEHPNTQPRAGKGRSAPRGGRGWTLRRAGPLPVPGLDEPWCRLRGLESRTRQCHRGRGGRSPTRHSLGQRVLHSCPSDIWLLSICRSCEQWDQG